MVKVSVHGPKGRGSHGGYEYKPYFSLQILAGMLLKKTDEAYNSQTLQACAELSHPGN